MSVCPMRRFTKRRYPGLNLNGNTVIMNDICDLNVLYEAFTKSLRSSAWKEEPQRFEMDFLSEISALKQELESRNYKTSKGTEFILNERGKRRHIHGKRMRDRVVRRALCDEILTLAAYPYLVYSNGASQKNKGTHFTRRLFERDLHNYYLKHGNNQGYVGFVDFSSYYDNIEHERVKAMYKDIIPEFAQWLLSEVLSTFEIDISYLSEEEAKEYINKKFKSLDYYEKIPKECKIRARMMAKSVDIGDHISQNIGTFFATPIDNYVKIVRGKKEYARHTDDMYIIGETREEVQSIIDGIKVKARENGLFVNEKKTYIAKLSDRYKYLQIRYSLTETGRVIKRISPQFMRRFRVSLKKFKRLMDAGRMNYEDIKQSYKTRMGGFYKYMSKRQIKNIRNLYKTLFKEDPRWKK